MNKYEIDEPVTLTRTNGDQTVTLPDDSLNNLGTSISTENDPMAAV